MKKFLLTIFTIGAFATLANAQCSELFFSEYVEGTYNNKALEIFNPTPSTITLTGNYRIVRWSNGSTNSDVVPATGDYVQPLTGTIASGETYTVFLDRRVVGAPAVDTILFANLLTIANNLQTMGQGGFYSPVYNAAVQGSKCVSFNGDDALSLQKSGAGGVWEDVDIFGCRGERPLDGNGIAGSGAWTDTPPYYTGVGTYLTKDRTLTRSYGVQSGVSVNPDTATFYALAEWDTLPKNTFDSLGHHSCLCTLGLNEMKKGNTSVSIYPNPSTNSIVYIRAKESISTIELFNELGKKVAEFAGNDLNKTFTLNTSSYPKGLYFVAVRMKDGTKSMKKITIQ
ncbi:MAG: T9SS type A sorting domain-containing protein [Bacteroidetes bacterium]|nr:T9SS type A sorting domain-containing protein [Bacteroidota bacterium]